MWWNSEEKHEWLTAVSAQQCFAPLRPSDGRDLHAVLFPAVEPCDDGFGLRFTHYQLTLVSCRTKDTLRCETEPQRRQLQRFQMTAALDRYTKLSDIILILALYCIITSTSCQSIVCLTAFIWADPASGRPIMLSMTTNRSHLSQCCTRVYSRRTLPSAPSSSRWACRSSALWNAASWASALQTQRKQEHLTEISSCH